MHIAQSLEKLMQLFNEAVDALLSQNNPQLAVEKCTEGLGINLGFLKNDTSFNKIRGLSNKRLRKYSAAIEDFTGAIAVEPPGNHADLLVMRAQCILDGGGDVEAALSDFNRATELNPQAPDPYQFRGRIYLAAGKATQAAGEFDRALRVLPDTEDDKPLRDEIEQLLKQARATQMKEAQAGQAAVASGAAGDADPVIFPGQPVAKLSDYVKIMKKMQTGDMNGALAPYGLDMMGYASVAGQWGTKLGADPVLNAKFMKLLMG